MLDSERALIQGLFDEMQRQMATMAGNIRERFDTTDDRLDRLSGRIDGLEARLRLVEQQVQGHPCDRHDQMLGEIVEAGRQRQRAIDRLRESSRMAAAERTVRQRYMAIVVPIVQRWGPALFAGVAAAMAVGGGG